MPTLLLDPPPAALQTLLERRRKLGQDRKDEVWEGVLHVVPAPSHRHADLVQQLAVILDGPARTRGRGLPAGRAQRAGQAGAG